MNCLSSSPCRRRFGFTVVELLVVVAMLVVLASILIPSARGARDAVNCARCRVNLKGLSQALQIWAVDRNQGKLPSAYGWQDVLAGDGIITHTESFFCPCDDNRGKPTITSGGVSELHLRIYGYSSQLLYSIYLFDGNQNVRRMDETPTYVRLWIEDLMSGRDWQNGPDINLGIQKTGRMRCRVLPLNPGHSPGYTHDLYRGNKLLLANVKTKIGTELDLLEASYGPTSYGMNNQVRPVPRAGQLLLLDYKRSVADVDGQGGYDDDLPDTLAPRHYGKLNIVLTDGSARTVSPLSVGREDPMWKIELTQPPPTRPTR